MANKAMPIHTRDAGDLWTVDSMPAYMHMGHNTENLIAERDLDEFKGIILSPVNRESDYLKTSVPGIREKGDYDIVLDPQLYFPRGQRGCVNKQCYFPSDFESADLSSFAWWQSLNASLAAFATDLGVNALVSPSVHPRIWDDNYFNTCVKISYDLSQKLAGTPVRVMTTVLVNINQLGDKSFPLRVASLMSTRPSSGFYLVLSGETEPRRELSDQEELFGIMSLIRELRRTGLPVLVSHCASDMMLFRAAGATDCATGKYFNLRRFAKSRYNEPAEGGGQLPYWFEHSLVAFLRESDLLRLERSGFHDLVGILGSGNSWSSLILANFRTVSRKPWIAWGWRQYLSWFGKTMAMLSGDDAVKIVQGWLKDAETNWMRIEDASVLMEEPRNNGTWLRPWRLALAEFVRTK